MNIEEIELSDRQKMILKTIVESHIKSGEPIGSKSIINDTGLGVSSATIRNVMVDLEAHGFLEQPHTSSGRIPTVKGYRTYVNNLMGGYSLTDREQDEVSIMTSKRLIGIDTLLKNAAETVSAITNYTAIAVKPRHKRVLVINFKVLPMNNYGILLIMQTSVGIVKTRFLEVGYKVSEETAKKLELTLNENLIGISTMDVDASIIEKMEDELSVISPLLVPLMRAFMEEIGELDGGELRMEGVNRMLQYPEYQNLSHLKELLGLLEKKDYILNVVAGAQKDAVNIFIGPDSEEDRLKGTSIIFKTITDNTRPIAAIGVVGPCRMNYSKVISVLDYLTDNISDALIDGTTE